MIRRGLLPHEWRALPRAERVELLAYEQLRDERRIRLAHDIIEQVGGELAVLVQIIMGAID